MNMTNTVVALVFLLILADVMVAQRQHAEQRRDAGWLATVV